MLFVYICFCVCYLTIGKNLIVYTPKVQIKSFSYVIYTDLFSAAV